MQIRTLLPLVLLTCGASLGLANRAPVEEVLKSSDHKKLGKAVAAYFQAKDELKGIQQAFDKLNTDMQKIDDGLQRKKGPALLSATEDWKTIFWLATAEGLDDKKIKKGKATEEAFDDVTVTYVVGKKYRAAAGPFPLVLIVPDEGQSPEAALDELWADEELREGAILAAVHMTAPSDKWGQFEGATDVMRTWGKMTRSHMFGFDYDRVFVAGHGKGFQAAAATAAAFPHLVTGLIGRGELGDVDAANFRNLPTHVGESDGGLAAKVTELGYGNNTKGADTAADIWTWIQATVRDAHPAHLTFTPPNPYAKGLHWITVEGVDLESGATIDAVADKASNTITITASGISTIKVFFNDVLVDLDAPVKVIVNGAEHESVVPRSASTLINGVYDRGDWGRILTNVQEYDVPTE